MSGDKSLLGTAKAVFDLAVRAKHAVDVGDWARDKFEEACLYAFLVWAAAERPRVSSEAVWDSFFGAAFWLLDELVDAGCISAEVRDAFRSSTPVWGLKEKGEADG